ncbi:TIGR02391 family protein [Corynebacterium striatum]
MSTPLFPSATINALARAIGDTEHGLKGDEIARLLQELAMYDPGEMTKWRRLEAAFTESQNTHGNAKRVVTFLVRAFDPARYVQRPELFDIRRQLISPILVLHGLRVTDEGQITRTKGASTLTEVQRLTNTVREELNRRGTHPEVLTYCEEEVLRHGYLHAVLEASKSVFQRLRDMTGLELDGSALADAALSVKSGVLAVNSLDTATEENEQTGMCSLVKSISGLYRNPTAHDPRLYRRVTETELYEALTLLSYVHRRLDGATVRA